MHHFTNGCVLVRILVHFGIAYIKCARRKSYSRDHFKYSWCALVTHFSFLFPLVISCHHLCILLCTSSCVSLVRTLCEFRVCVFDNVFFFRFAILFAWAVIVDAVQFTYVYTRLYLLSHRRSHKIFRLLRWQRRIECHFQRFYKREQANERTTYTNRKRQQVPNGEKIGLYQHPNNI